jgi:predicted nucleic acid-binding protein
VAARRSEPAIVALDTSCIVALVSTWHTHHEITSEALERRFASGARITVPAHALTEAYAVLTRLPAPNRLSPSDAITVLRDNFGKDARIETLEPREYWTLLRDAPAKGVYGGRIYDGIIAACARKAGAGELLTLNLKHFESFGDESLRITSPA